MDQQTKCPYDNCAICQGMDMTILTPNGTQKKVLHMRFTDNGACDMIEDDGEHWRYDGVTFHPLEEP